MEGSCSQSEGNTLVMGSDLDFTRGTGAIESDGEPAGGVCGVCGGGGCGCMGMAREGSFKLKPSRASTQKGRRASSPAAPMAPAMWLLASVSTRALSRVPSCNSRGVLADLVFFMVAVVDESGEPRRVVSTGDIAGDMMGEIGKKGGAMDGDDAEWQREGSVEARLMASSMELLLLLDTLFLTMGHRRPRQRLPEW